MADGDFKNQDWPGGRPPIGTGEGESPLMTPPQANVSVRTMASDTKSIQESGGGAPRPYVPPPSVPSSPAPETKPVFVPPQAETYASPKTMAAPSAVVPPKQTGSKKGLFVGLVVAIIIVGLAALGYFVVYPMLGENATVENNPPAPVVPAVETPPTEPLPPTPEEPIAAPTATSTPTSTEPSAPTASKWPALETHLSFLKTGPDNLEPVSLQTVSLNEIKQAITFATSETPTLKEVVLKNAAGKVVSAQELSQLIAPEFFSDELVGNFETDPTYLVFKNMKGSWPILILKAKEGVNVGPIQDGMSKLQKDPNNQNFFLSSPGESGAWQDGNIRTKPSSLVNFAQDGATLSYTWFDRYLLIGTNLDGSSEAAKRLGF